MSYLGPETEILHERYAEALIDVAEEAGRLDDIADNLTFLNELVSKQKHLAKILQHPEVAKEDKLNALAAISKEAGFCDEFYGFLEVLVRKSRLDLIHGVFLRYCDLYQERKSRLKVFIKTAASLSKAQIARLKDILSRKLKKDIIVEESVQPGLIGGMVLRIGDLVYNLSLVDRLNFMQERLTRLN